MNKHHQILAYRTILGMYAASIVEDETKTDEIKSQKWYQNAYKIYKKCKGLRKVYISSNETKLLRGKLDKIRDLEDKYFINNEWNPYALCIMCLEHLVNELDFIELKGLLIDLDIVSTRTMLEKSEDYKELQKVSYRYFNEITEILGD